MDFKKVKRNWELSKTLIIFSMIFNLIQTIYFTIEYGFHYEAINLTEAICDFIGEAIFYIGLYFFFAVVYDVLENLFSEEESPKD